MIIPFHEAQELTARAIQRGWIQLAETILSTDDALRQKKREQSRKWSANYYAKKRARVAEIVAMPDPNATLKRELAELKRLVAK